MDASSSCPHAATCGGCPSIDRSVDEQLARKRERVLCAVRRYPALASLDVRAVAAADPVFAYRTRAKLVVGPGGRIGLFARDGDHVVVDIPGCRVLSPALTETTATLRDLLRARALPTDRVRAVDLREARGSDDRVRVLVTLVLERRSQPPSEEDLAAWATAIVSRAPAVASFAVSFREPASVQVLGRDLRVVTGPAALADAIAEGPTPWVPAVHGGFVQVHRGQAARLRALVADGLATALGDFAGRHVVDAYAGSGATGFALATRGARVTLVETHVPSVEHARRAALEQGLAVDVVAGDAASALATLRDVDAIVLNPPRRGVDPEARLAAAAAKPRAIAVVSCEPETLARDLDHLARLGWAAESLQPLDMLPQTDEVETIAILGPRPVPPLTVLHEDRDLVAVDKPAWSPARFRQADPLYRLDVGTSGVCLFATSSDVPAIAEPEAEIVALVRGVVRERGIVTVRNAKAELRRTRVVGGQSLVCIRSSPVRVEALRRALAHMGHPVLGDDRHGHAPSNRHWLERHGLDRPFLHCARMGFRHPRTGETVVIEAPLPGELTAVLARHGA